MSYPIRVALKGLLLFTAYFLSARLGLSLSAVSGFASFVWIPTGLSFAALFLWGRQYWPAVFAAATLVNFTSGASPFLAMIIGSGNTLEALVGVTLFMKFAGKDSRLEKVRDICALVFFGAFFSTMISATVGVFTLHKAGIIPQDIFRTAWLTWWIGDLISNLVFAPFLIVWSKKPKARLSFARGVEGFLLTAAVIGICVLIFFEYPVQEVDVYLRPYWIFILLIWTTLRFGQHANVLLTVFLSAIAIYGTIHGEGPYDSDSLPKNLLLLQLFTSAVALCGLFFGALGREKNEAIRMRTDFISIASHELRTPVTSLSLSVNVLKEVFGDDKRPMGAQVIEALDRQSKKIVRLVDSLLNVAQIESGNLILEKRDTDFSVLVRDTISGLSDIAERSRTEIKTDLTGDIRITCSAYGIEQVITNLIHNSLKYGEGKPITVSLDREGKMARLSVIDHGRGIAKENHGRIFERYERVDQSPESNGLGLGLYVSKLIVEDHQGSIEVVSEEKKGATFVVRLPLG